MPRRKSTRRRAPRADWVYRPTLLDQGGTVVSAGTYSLAAVSVAAGEASKTALVLYDSHDFARETFSFAGGTQEQAFASGEAVPLPSAMRADEHRSAMVLGVQGWVNIRPTTWTTSDSWNGIMRIGIFEQDPINGDILTVADHSLVSNLAGTYSVVTSANIPRENLWELRDRQVFSTANDQANWNRRIFLRFRRRLANNEALVLLVAQVTGSVTLQYQCHLRTLVQAT